MEVVVQIEYASAEGWRKKAKTVYRGRTGRA